MAKRVCDPTVGSIGNQTYLLGRNGQVVRTRAVPSNPNTPQQIITRANLRACAIAFDALTQAQIAAWNAAAADQQTKARLGMSGAMTGLQYFVKVNGVLMENGQARVTDPPVVPAIAAAGADTASFENDGGVLTASIHFTGALPANTELWASAPQNAGVTRTPAMVHLGTVPALVGNAANITALYSAKYGVPAVGQVVFVKVATRSGGFYGPEEAFRAVVSVPG